MRNFELGGYYLADGGRVQLPLIVQPSMVQIMNYLDVLQNNDGILILDNDQEDNHTPYKMTLYSDNGIYMILFETSMDDGDIDVRTFYDQSESENFISILGEPYAEISTVKEFSSVLDAFKEFYETGDVSRELLD
ncbi:DUF6911 family protein [Pectobacterium parmentieri]|uniref:DUF6911 family protein n=1 Tax=Pectobacterium parmentieri TaxID=1905730 RepID=UPI000473A04C|nr:hypothetical protein [Pectobacterium parmentieri]PWD60860.1 hypothetical protein DF211_15670 [Pectobacterium parmentieri]